MTVPTGTKENLDQAFHALTHPSRKERDSKKEEEHRPRKHFHVHELHDGTYHVEKDHGEGEMESASADDLDGVHDHLEEMMGTPNEGEEHGEEH